MLLPLRGYLMPVICEGITAFWRLGKIQTERLSENTRSFPKAAFGAGAVADNNKILPAAGGDKNGYGGNKGQN